MTTAPKESIAAKPVLFVVPGDPKTKRRHRTAIRNGKVLSYSDTHTVQAQKVVATYYRQMRGPGRPATEGCGIEAVFHVQTRQRRDIDNYMKLLMDALTGIAWVDDSQVTEMIARVHHGSDNPRTVARVYPTEDLPDHQQIDCANCGTAFRLYTSWSKRKYCSKECSAAAQRKRKPHLDRTCTQCGAQYRVKDSRVSTTSFCSRACRTAAGSVTVPCANCGTPVTKFKSQASSGSTYCSRACRYPKAGG